MDRPRVVLYEDENRVGSVPTIDDSSTPLDSIVSPAVYYQDNYSYPIKIPRRGSKSVSDTPTQFLRQLNDNSGMAYPDDHDNRFVRFMKEPTTQIIVCVIFGTALGALLSHLQVSTDISNLVNLPGRAFLRVLKCFVIPMVFASLSTGIANIVLLGKVSTIGTRTAFFFVTFSLTAVIISLSVTMTLRHLNRQMDKIAATKTDGWFHVHCDNGKYLEMTSTEVLQCSAPAMGNETHFMIEDLDSALTTSTTAMTTKISVSEQLASILNSLFPNNIFTSFVDGVLLSVITFAIAFGAAATRASSRENSPLLDVLNQMNKIFFFIIARVIDWSPLAVLSLVAGSLSSQENMNKALSHVGVLLLCNVVAALLLEFVFYPIVLWAFLRKSPFPYMRAMLPAVTFAFGSASSLATLPVTIRCVESTREVSRSLLQFVVTIGCTVHMNGSALYFPNAIVFLAMTSNADINLGWVQVCLIAFVSLLSSIGVAPIPNSGLIMIYSIWSTIFPNAEVPMTYSYLVAIHWLMDRMNTACNVVGDTYVARIIAEQVDEAYETAFHQDQDE